jgi:hypothetical protein
MIFGFFCKPNAGFRVYIGRRYQTGLSVGHPGTQPGFPDVPCIFCLTPRNGQKNNASIPCAQRSWAWQGFVSGTGLLLDEPHIFIVV